MESFDKSFQTEHNLNVPLCISPPLSSKLLSAIQQVTPSENTKKGAILIYNLYISQQQSLASCKTCHYNTKVLWMVARMLLVCSGWFLIPLL